MTDNIIDLIEDNGVWKTPEQAFKDRDNSRLHKVLKTIKNTFWSVTA